MIKGALTIIFDYPFYKAIFERTDGSEYYVAQVNLGTSMPHMPQILNMVNFKFSKLKFYKTSIEKQKEYHVNPKRAQRLAHKAIKNSSIGTKAQQDLKRQFEEKKIMKKKAIKVSKEQETERRYLLRQKKKYAKHRGH